MKAGIVGLPNVGKSTLFNALTRTRKAEAANYPFCTIEPNVGVVVVPDERLEPLCKIVKSKTPVPAVIEILDIAGLVAGASKGEGLGNKFLANIRETDAIIQVVRCFDDEDIIHTAGTIDPVRDIEIITTELVLADLQSAETQLDRNQKKVKAQDKEAIANVDLLSRIVPHLNQNKPITMFDGSDEDRARLKTFFFLSAKPVVYACNVAESDIADPEKNPYVAKVREYVRTHHDAGACVICSRLEEELGELTPEEGIAYLKDLGVTDSGVSILIKETYKLLGLASYLTAGEKEVRAWTFHRGMTAPQCAGVIHTDFEKGFIKAEVVAYDDLVSKGSYAAAREAGKYRIEGRDYIVQDGDVMLFRFNV
ncbi:MAG: redox-regulated ATPase YchF [Verrucomicrobiota bacterium]|nr:redox-regulated ATPase YchF [Verrucomicrobiota bacterium]